MAPCVAFALPVAGSLRQRKTGAVRALNEGSLGRGRQMETSERGTRNIPEGALFPWEPRLNPATTAREAAPSTSSTPVHAPVHAVAAVGEEPLYAQQQQQGRCSPLGCMFRPELTKDGVAGLVSQVLCRPGFTQGASDERRLLKSVRTGRIDIRTMSRILRWLAGDRATRELQRRGIEFVGPKQATASSPYTTGQGMTQLMNEVIARNGAGTRFIVCFSSRFDACSSAISGVLINAAFPASEPPAFDCSRPSSGPVAGCGGGAISEDARTVSTCSSFSDAEDDDRMAPCSTTPPVSVDLVPETKQAAARKGAGGAAPGGRSKFVGVAGVNVGNMSAGGDRTTAKRTSGEDSGACGAVMALLLDEKPKHRLCNSGGGSGGANPRTAGFGGEGGGGVHGMPVQEWVEAYGDCDGPMLAAWVFPGYGQ